MSASLLFAVIITPLSFAMSESERIANLDSELVFRAFEKAAIELSEKNLESLEEFKSNRWDLEKPFEEYCDSIKNYPKIYRQCGPLKKAAANWLDLRETFLAKTVKVDKYLEVVSKLDSFFKRGNDLRAVQENGKNIDADTLREKRLSLEKEMLEYCPKVPRADLAQICLRQAKRTGSNLTKYEISLRSNTYKDPPRKARIYSDTTPVVRCFFELPSLSDPTLQYKISDPSGRYRYEHLTKARLDYALNVKLTNFTEREVNHPLMIQKTFTDPRSAQTFTATIASAHSCKPANAPPPQCIVKDLALSINLKGEKEISATSTVPIALDSHFTISLPFDPDTDEEFSLNCAIASNMRKGGWIYSDESFEEK